ncbi:MAG TPA: homoserine O-succinyltransferase [Rhizomicrobium sp.]
MAVVAAPRARKNKVVGSEFCIELGLVNNMPDSALERTERQFIHLLGAAASDLLVRVSFFSLQGLARGAAGRNHLQRNSYRPILDVPGSELDALIVTGTEPRFSDLRLEPYWSELADLIDWVVAEGPSTVFSCLAAHAALLRRDGIERQRLAEKRFGVFRHFVIGHDIFTPELPHALNVAHSRWNEVCENALVSNGYRILTSAPEAGVDLFLKRGRTDLLFCQGHPEYDPGTPGREYHRDVRRYLQRESNLWPALPRNYFTLAEKLLLEQYRERAMQSRDPSLIAEYPKVRRRPETRWQPPAAPVFHAWLEQIVEAKRSRRRSMRESSSDSFFGKGAVRPAA